MTTQLYGESDRSQNPVSTNRDGVNFLRRVIQWDAGLICAIALVLLLLSEPIATFMGIANPTFLLIAGFVGLLYDGGRLLWSRIGNVVDIRLVQLSFYGNAIWAIISIPMLAFEWLPLSNGGWWAMAGLADLAALFAILQWYGLRQTKQDHTL